MDGSEGSEGSQGPNSNTGQDGPTTQQHQHQQFLGDASTAIPNFRDIDTTGFPLPEGVTVENIRSFEKMYREHAEVRKCATVIKYFNCLQGSK